MPGDGGRLSYHEHFLFVLHFTKAAPERIADPTDSCKLNRSFASNLCQYFGIVSSWLFALGLSQASACFDDCQSFCQRSRLALDLDQDSFMHCYHVIQS